MNVLWYDPIAGKVEMYCSDEHGIMAFKFLFWGDETDGTLLVGCLSTEIRHHRELLRLAKGHVPDTPLIAAGTCRTGKIRGWRSFDFDITTPLELRSIIREVLGLEEEIEEIS